MTKNTLINQEVAVVNIGIASFADAVKQTGGKAVNVEWKPPADIALNVLTKLETNAKAIEEANQKALDILQRGKAEWVGMGIARDVIPNMTENTLLHAGPPITWDKMCGPMKGAMIGAVIYEGKAKDASEAEAKLAGGEFKFAPCHEHNTVGPMAGVVSPSMPVFIIENSTFGNKAYCTQNEGLGKVLRYGAYSEEVITRLKWLEQELYPTLDKAIKYLGKVDIKSIIAQALHMGDEVHNRNRSGTSLLIRAIAPAILRTSDNKEIAAKALEFINSNDHFFLNFSMPACKVMLDAARNVKGSSMLVVMARNGTEFGIQLSGTGNKWWTGKALVPDALFFPGYTKDDANPDIGDSAITETGGLGGFAIASSPAIVQFVGGTSADAVRYTMEMYEIAVGENQTYSIPYLDFRGTPTGIDAVKVVKKGITPFIDTGVAHKNAGVGQVGAGVVNAPMEPFVKAACGLADTL